MKTMTKACLAGVAFLASVAPTLAQLDQRIITGVALLATYVEKCDRNVVPHRGLAIIDAVAVRYPEVYHSKRQYIRDQVEDRADTPMGWQLWCTLNQSNAESVSRAFRTAN